jgi:hypothetical protein
MKKLIPVLFIAIVSIVFTSCKKDEGKSPNIALKTTAGYTSANATVAKNTAIKFGITASKAEDKDVLKTFDATKSLDGGAPASFETQTLTGADQDAYDHDVTITTRNVAGTEKYTFTVVNRDGLTNYVSVTLTVN